MLHLSTILLLDFENIPSVVDFVFHLITDVVLHPVMACDAGDIS